MAAGHNPPKQAACLGRRPPDCRRVPALSGSRGRPGLRSL